MTSAKITNLFGNLVADFVCMWFLTHCIRLTCNFDFSTLKMYKSPFIHTLDKNCVWILSFSILTNDKKSGGKNEKKNHVRHGLPNDHSDVLHMPSLFLSSVLLFLFSNVFVFSCCCLLFSYKIILFFLSLILFYSLFRSN